MSLGTAWIRQRKDWTTGFNFRMENEIEKATHKLHQSSLPFTLVSSRYESKPKFKEDNASKFGGPQTWNEK